MLIRSIEINDLEKIASLHLRSFDKYHFSSHFSKSLLESYFKSVLYFNHYSYLAEENGEILGYLIGGNQTEPGLRKFLKENFFNVIGRILVNPLFLAEKINAVFLRLKKKQFSKAEYRIYIIAIAPEKQGTGIGKKLLMYFEEQLSKNNINLYGLSVRKWNRKAELFYIKNGFKLENKSNVSIYFMKEI